MKLTKIVFIASLSLVLFGCPGYKEKSAPVASFEIDKSKPGVNETVLFTNTSKQAKTYQWDFGDGKTSEDASPQHVYVAEGTYVVKLTATGDGEKKIFSKEITVANKPVASFETEESVGVVKKKLKFKNTSTNATSYFWDFGDGETSTEENPAHFYSLKGTYSVVLTATGDGGVETVAKEYVIKDAKKRVKRQKTSEEIAEEEARMAAEAEYAAANPAPVEEAVKPAKKSKSKPAKKSTALVASFTIDKPTALANEIITFQNNSENGKKYFWDFGDGTTSIEDSPMHSYDREGRYLVKLRVEKQKQKKTVTDSVVISGFYVNFTTDKDSVAVSEPMAFSPIVETPEVAYSVYSWDFGDGNSSLEKNPVHVYAETGEYTVGLTTAASAKEATDSTEAKPAITRLGSKKIKIVEKSVLPAKQVVAQESFKMSRTTAAAGEKIDFSSTSKNAKKFVWDFGNKDKAKKKVVTYSYPKPGTYTVTLTEEGKGIKKTTSSRTIIITEPVAFFEVNKNSVKTNEDISFKRTSQYGDKPEWDFGDGKSSKEEKPKHSYKKEGTYTVTLKEKGSSGKRASTKTVFVESVPLDFDMSKTTAYAKDEVSFTNKSSYGQTYTWDFGDLTAVSTTKDAKHIYQNPGTYTIVLKVQGDMGEKIVTKNITVKEVEEDEITDGY